MNIDIEKKKINAKFQDPAFVADFNQFTADIKFDGEHEVRNIFGDWASYGKQFDEADVINLLQKAQTPLNGIIDNFYQTHGTEYADAREFLSILKETLRINIKSQIANAKIAAGADTPIIVPEDIEQKREQLLFKLQGQSTNNSPDYIDYMIIYNEIATCSPEKLQCFIENLQARKQEKIEMLGNAVQTYQKKLATNDFQSKGEKFDIEKLLEIDSQILQYYQNVDIFEAVAPLTYQSNLNGGNSLSSVFIEKHIDTSRFDAEVATLQFINNLIESIDKGLVSQNAYFNGSAIIDKRTGKRIYNQEVDITEFLDNITNLSRLDQTNFAYNPSIVEKWLKDKKFPIAGFKTQSEDGNVENRYTVYSVSEFSTPKQSLLPLFVKHIEEDKANGTFSVMLYVFEKPDLTFGTQIYRIDKVPPMSRRGTAKHKQTSGEVIETNVHVHEYNLFDRVILNAKKPEELGHGDISTNFITDTQIDNTTLELLVNQKCNIDREPMEIELVVLPESSETQPE